MLALWEDGEALPAEVSYLLAGAFVAFMIRQGGTERFLQLCRNQTVEHAGEVYGDDLAGLIADFEIQL